MESLLLSGNIITLKEIRSTLYGIESPTIIDGIEIVPNGIHSFDPNRCLINRDIVGNAGGDSAILRNNGEEYPLFYSLNSFGVNPGYISYGKKDGEDLVLLQEIFSDQPACTGNPELIKCLFFRINESIVFGRSRSEIKGKLIFDPNTKKCNRYDAIRKVIGVKDMLAIEECLDCCQKIFRLTPKS